jgi:hypothetical protein
MLYNVYDDNMVVDSSLNYMIGIVMNKHRILLASSLQILCLLYGQ